MAVNVSDVDLDRRQIQITGRATRGRLVSLASDDVLIAMSQYLDLRAERTLSTPALFVGRSGTRLTIYSIENIFKKHVRLAEIKRHITPHSLRHTMAAMLVSNGTWTNSFADNDAGQWSEVNNGTGDDHGSCHPRHALSSARSCPPAASSTAAP